MNIEDFLKETGNLYDYLLSLEDDDDYEINDVQFRHLMDILEFFVDICKECNGTYEPCELSPRKMHGGLTMRFHLLSLDGENIGRFCDLMRYTSAISIDAETDGRVCYSITVPYVFVKKE